MSLVSRITCIAILLCSFLFILATGRVNVRNFEKVQNSIEEIYADRLVVKALIYELSTLLHQKHIAVISNDSSFFTDKNKAVNSQTSSYLKDFRATKLTDLEESTLNKFSRSIEELQTIEGEINLSEPESFTPNSKEKLISKIKGLKEDLNVLSGIQLSEGKMKLKTSDIAVDKMHEYKNIENYGLLLIGFLILVLFFLPGKKGHRFWSSKAGASPESDDK